MASLVTGSIVGALVGNEVLTSTIRTSTSSIYTGLSSLMINPNFYFKNVLEELDIEAKLKVITKFIDNIKETTLQEHNKIALNSIYTIIHKIEAEITEINKEIHEHSKKWFNTFRRCNYTNQIDNLKKHVKIMDNRFDLYMKIVF